ncbi:hypothetical protein NHP20013_13960 [Helicobacter bizzozeronii]|nr:hypothetical protein NHP20013_13960 [Helicobacter bizzozeronii]
MALYILGITISIDALYAIAGAAGLVHLNQGAETIGMLVTVTGLPAALVLGAVALARSRSERDERAQTMGIVAVSVAGGLAVVLVGFVVLVLLWAFAFVNAFNG